MTTISSTPLRSLEDIVRFEQEMPLQQRISARSVFDIFCESARLYTERLALTMVMTGEDDEQPRRVTYRELLGLIHRAANLFHCLAGPRPGVAYMLPSLVETHATLWGAEAAGFAVPINFLLQPEHIADLIVASGASVLVALGPHTQLDIWEKALHIKTMLPQIALVRVGSASTPGTDAAVDFNTALMQQPADHLVFGSAGSDDEVAAYFHTGGTTGVPKLVPHSHRNQIAAAFGGSVLMHMQETNVALNGFPLFHVAGTIFSGLSQFLSGAEVVMLSPSGFRNPAMLRRYWKLVERYRATRIGGVPTVVGALCDVPLDGADLSSVQCGGSGAASIPPAVVQRFEAHTGHPLHEVLGMTETAGLTCIDPAFGKRVLGSVGFRLPYTQVVVRRLNADGSLGGVCGTEEIGVLTVTGPTVSKGYLQAEQNKGVFVDGVLNSGDLAYTGADGRIYIAGRAKDLIIRSGHNIDPLIIEDVMCRHSAVSMAAAVSQPDVYAGELPVCYVSLHAGAVAADDELQAWAQQYIAERPAWPKHFYVVPSIPVTAVGKIFKPQLRCDATVRLVRRIIQENMGLTQVDVTAQEGGKRGMSVIVTLARSEAHLASSIQQSLGAYLFESTIVVESPMMESVQRSAVGYIDSKAKLDTNK